VIVGLNIEKYYSPPYQEKVILLLDPEEAPEKISKAVASLPPEQMFELMKQMMFCIRVIYHFVTTI